MLGETPDQIANRYGAPVKSYQDIKGRFGHLYRSEGYQIMVQFLEGRSHAEVYTKQNDAEFSQGELDAIMSANSAGDSWQKVPNEISKSSGVTGWVILRTRTFCIYGPCTLNDQSFQHAVSVSTPAHLEHDKSSTLLRLQIEAEGGASEAQFELGKAYEFGKYSQQDYVAAAHWYLTAAEQGNFKAQCNLGVIYAQGRVSGKNITDANHWFERAAEAGYHQAQLNLAMSYLRGNGVEKNGALAIHWATKAAEQGYAIAQRQLGQMHSEGLAGTKDPVQGSFWLNKAAEQGDVDAMFLMGNLHFSLAKNLETRDPEEWCHVGDAVIWYCKAAKRGQKDAEEMKAKIKGVIPRKLFDYYEAMGLKEQN
jgi:TPR repeat protein